MVSVDGRSLSWHSARCDSGACVEVAHHSERIIVRDSGDPDGARLVFTAEAWREFIDEVRTGSFGPA